MTMQHKTVVQRLAEAEKRLDDYEKRLAAAERKLKASGKADAKEGE